MPKLRSPIQYYGGKGNMLGRLLPLIPLGGRPYIEPYFGGGSVFFARDPAPVEVINDLDGDVVNLMRTLQDRTKFEELKHRLTYTPYARAEFGRAIEILEDNSASDVDRAWAKMVACNFGMSGKHKTIGNWGRVFVSNRGMAGTTSKWNNRLDLLDAFHKRLMMAQIDNRDALEVIKYWDTPEAVIYCDPPYHPDTRKSKNDYVVEQDHEHHEKLVEVLLNCKGAVVLSCYEHPVYKPLIDFGWEITKFQTSCHAAGRIRGSGLQGEGAAKKKVRRIEVVIRNRKAVELTRNDTEDCD